MSARAPAERLPNPIPDDPLPLVRQWLDRSAGSSRRNPHAMALATAAGDGSPSVRLVLLKGFSVAEGYAVFYTHYGSRKAAELEASGRAAAVLYWDDLGRQLRFEGRVLRSPAAESDAYYATRPWLSQLNAWTSEQSKPLADPADLQIKAAQKAHELGFDVDASAPLGPLPRPAFWGGFRLWLERIEFWVEGASRFHERLYYTRELTAAGANYRGGSWSHVRLQP
jgi:pyridoxamine 5'-phosphate oxidase